MLSAGAEAGAGTATKMLTTLFPVSVLDPIRTPLLKRALICVPIRKGSVSVTAPLDSTEYDVPELPLEGADAAEPFSVWALYRNPPLPVKFSVPYMDCTCDVSVAIRASRKK